MTEEMYSIEEQLAVIAKAVKTIVGATDLPTIEPANPKFKADFALPCFALAKALSKSPQAIAADIAEKLTHPALAKVEAQAGFVNLWLSDELLLGAMQKVNNTFGTHSIYAGQEIVIEHTDPNPFKEFHIGHAYSNTVGEALGRLYKAAGAKVHQVSYHGDVGMHIAKALWGIQKLLATGEGEWFTQPGPGQTLDAVNESKRTAFLGAGYALGATAYKEDEQAAEEMKAINKHVYAGNDAALNILYKTGLQWSFHYFDAIYQQLQVRFERAYMESEIGPEGQDVVQKHIGTIFEKSDGAVVYHGAEKANLHTRVFINSQGLPTYEAKEVGLTFAKQHDYPAMSRSVVVTANEIEEYFKVLIAAIRELDPSLAKKMLHIPHGVVKLTSGKMSSRTGQVIRSMDVLQDIRDIVAKNYGTKVLNEVALGALKYAFLKHRIGGDIVFDLQESVSLQGNSGPYLQYAHARGRSILAKLDTISNQAQAELTDDEHKLAVKMLEYPAVTKKAIEGLAPHHICTYLYELTQQFNAFYEHNRIIGDPRQTVRAQLVRAYCQVLKNGLELLNIPALERM